MVQGYIDKQLTQHFLRSWRSSLCRCLTTSKWNVEGGRQRVMWLVFSGFSFGYFDGRLD